VESEGIRRVPLLACPAVFSRECSPGTAGQDSSGTLIRRDCWTSQQRLLLFQWTAGGALVREPIGGRLCPTVCGRLRHAPTPP
jgi:hypothetical protein